MFVSEDKLTSGSSPDLSGAADSAKEALESVDYSDTLQQIASLVAYCDLALLVIAVLAFLAIGVLIGHMVTRWMHGH